MKSGKRFRRIGLSLAMLFTFICCMESLAIEAFAQYYGPEILITEVVPFSQTNDDAYEFIELYNNSGSSVDLKNYKLPKQNIDITSSEVIKPKGVMVICIKSTTTLASFNAFYGTSLTADKYMTLPVVSGVLSNVSNDSIILSKDDGTVVAEAQYDTSYFELKKSITYKYMTSGYEMSLLGQKQGPTPGSVAYEQVPSSGTSVTGVSLDREYLNMDINKTAVLHAEVYPSTASNKSLQWTSSDPNVVSVDGNGFLTAWHEGTSVITAATIDGGYTDYCTVTIGRIPVTGINLDRSSMALQVGEAIILIPSIAPVNATNKSITWYSNNPNIANVSGDGVVTGKSQGSAVITASTVDGSFTDTCYVTVTGSSAYISVKGVSLNKTGIQMSIGSVMILEARINPDNASNKNVVWSSNNSNIVSVDENGIVSAKGEGTCFINVKTAEGGYTASCQVKVTNTVDDNTSVTDVRINKLLVFVKAGKTEKLEAKIVPGDAQDKTVTWESSDDDVASVTSNGLVTGMKEGFALITVTTEDGSHSDKCLVIVMGDKWNNHGKGNGNVNGNGKGKGHLKYND